MKKAEDLGFEYNEEEDDDDVGGAFEEGVFEEEDLYCDEEDEEEDLDEEEYEATSEIFDLLKKSTKTELQRILQCLYKNSDDFMQEYRKFVSIVRELKQLVPPEMVLRLIQHCIRDLLR